MNKYSTIINPIECDNFKQGNGIHIWIISTKTKASSNNQAVSDIIKNYLPHDFRVIKNDQGKPFIKSSWSPELHISSAHSNTL